MKISFKTDSDLSKAKNVSKLWAFFHRREVYANYVDGNNLWFSFLNTKESGYKDLQVAMLVI